MATVNGVTVAADTWGVVVGTGNGDHISGGSGNDTLEGTGGNDIYYGGAGNDTFIITASSLAASSGTTDNINALAVIFDFQGAGTWTSTNNDFLALTGFGAGSTLTFDHYGGTQTGALDVTQQYYTVHDTTTGNNYTIYIHSLDGSQIKAGDYAFY
ncbi:MAG TPA: hypothetical protein VFF98_04355 [Novosphingobium sp.]|nr:hypothetical protein [Novosphingobium sp.]